MTLSKSNTYQNITATMAASLIHAECKPTLFDVRDLADYRQGHIADAAHLTESRLMAWFGRLSKDQPIVIYCYKGNASKTFAQMFADFRFTHVHSVEGGYAPLATALADSGQNEENESS